MSAKVAKAKSAPGTPVLKKDWPVQAATSVQVIHGSGCQPPKNTSVITQAPTVMLAYSPTKKNPNLKLLYSVWYPPTRSVSDSGMSNGRRFVSANSAMTKISAESGWAMKNQTLDCASTMRTRLSEPLVPGALIQMNTGSTAMPMASS